MNGALPRDLPLRPPPLQSPVSKGRNMAPRIPNTPSVKTFVETWSSDFTAAMKKAAGKDGRLTLSEAKKLAQSSGPEKMFADDAVDYLQRTGKKSVSVSVIAAEMKAFAQRAAESAAGPDGKVSLADGKKLPQVLEDDFFLMRGKAVPGTPAPGGDAMAQAKTALEAATNGLLMPSETDANFIFMQGSALNGAPITPAVVRAQLTAQHDAQIANVMYTDPSERSLAAKTQVEQLDGNQFLDRIIGNVDPNDPASQAMGQKFAALKATLSTQLTDLTVLRFGTISISTFIVGRTHDGQLAGLLTGQVET